MPNKLPVVPEHKQACDPNCDMWECPQDQEYKAKCDRQICVPDCPACAVEANNKAWAKYLVGLHNWLKWSKIPQVGVYIPASDWEQIKKLAEEKVDG